MARNKYPGTCYFCGKPVPAGAGHFERHFDAYHNVQWLIIHSHCVFIQREQKEKAKAASKRAAEEETQH